MHSGRVWGVVRAASSDGGDARRDGRKIRRLTRSSGEREQESGGESLARDRSGVGRWVDRRAIHVSRARRSGGNRRHGGRRNSSATNQVADIRIRVAGLTPIVYTFWEQVASGGSSGWWPETRVTGGRSDGGRSERRAVRDGRRGRGEDESGGSDWGGCWAGEVGDWTGAGDGDAGSDGNATNAGKACVADSAGKAGRDCVVSDGRVERVDEPVAGYPKRAGPTRAAPVRELRRRTLTNLYNERPQWLVDAHGELDGAVAGAYGWEPDVSNDQALRKLLELNSRG